jgi:hypothetical protein
MKGLQDYLKSVQKHLIFLTGILILITLIVAHIKLESIIIGFQTPIKVTFQQFITVKNRENNISVQIAQADEVSEIVEPPSAIDQMKIMICSSFKNKDCNIALAITRAESNFNPTDIGYNCEYTNNKVVESTSCKTGDQSKAWSVDCGLMQINVLGQTCPTQLFDIQYNINMAYGKFAARNNTFQAWSSYNSGAYKQYLAK